MASTEDKVNCLLWLAELKRISVVRRRFTTHYRKAAPHRNSISIWMQKLKETGSMNDRLQNGKPRLDKETVASVEEAFM
jgi:hypothetical protein